LYLIVSYLRAHTHTHTQLGTTKNSDPCLLRHTHMNTWERSRMQKIRRYLSVTLRARFLSSWIF